MALHEIANLILPLGFISIVLYIIVASSPVYAVLGLIVALLCFSAILLALGYELLALVYVMVYIGAVMVLFLWVVMTIPLKKDLFSLSTSELCILAGFSTVLLVVIVLWLMVSPTSTMAVMPTLSSAQDPVYAEATRSNVYTNFLAAGDYWDSLNRFVMLRLKRSGEVIAVGPAKGNNFVLDWAFYVNRPRTLVIMYDLFYRMIAGSFDPYIYHPTNSSQDSAYSAHMARAYIDYMRYKLYPGSINPDLDPTYGLDYLGSWKFDDAKPILWKKKLDVRKLELLYTNWALATMSLYGSLYPKNIDYHTYFTTRASATMAWQHIDGPAAVTEWFYDHLEEMKVILEFDSKGAIIRATPKTPIPDNKPVLPFEYIPRTNNFLLNFIIDYINYYREEVFGVSLKRGIKTKHPTIIVDCTKLVPVFNMESRQFDYWWSPIRQECPGYYWKPWPKPEIKTHIYVPYDRYMTFKPADGAWGMWGAKYVVQDIFRNIPHKVDFDWVSLVQGTPNFSKASSSSIGKILYRHLSIELIVVGLILIAATVASITLVRFKTSDDCIFVEYRYGNG